jgi:ribosomal silencing factor RsfS
MEKHGHRPETLEGYGEASWVLVSYGDVIAHIMNETQRDYYKLEDLWSGVFGPAGKKSDAAPEAVGAEGSNEPARS